MAHYYFKIFNTRSILTRWSVFWPGRFFFDPCIILLISLQKITHWTKYLACYSWACSLRINRNRLHETQKYTMLQWFVYPSGSDLTLPCHWGLKMLFCRTKFLLQDPTDHGTNRCAWKGYHDRFVGLKSAGQHFFVGNRRLLPTPVVVLRKRRDMIHSDDSLLGRMLSLTASKEQKQDIYSMRATL